MATLGPLPDLFAQPMHTVCWTPLTTTVETTGDGGNPPPTNTLEREEPPHSPVTPIALEALSIFTRYPRASPKVVAHDCCDDIGRLVLNATIPLAMIAVVTVCSPRPGKSMNHPFADDVGVTPPVVQDVAEVKLSWVDVLSRLVMLLAANARSACVITSGGVAAKSSTYM